MSGNLWKFSDQLDDVDAIMMQKDYITLKEGAAYYNFSLKIFTRIAIPIMIRNTTVNSATSG